MLSIKPSSLHVQIMRELVNNGIEIYQFPVDDETFAENNARMNVSVDMYTQTCAHTHYSTHSLNTSNILQFAGTASFCCCWQSG